MHGQAGEAVVAAANMAALFSACFLVAVTQHTSSSHVIIGVGGGGWNGNPWQLMQGLNHVLCFFCQSSGAAGGHFSSQRQRCARRGRLFCHPVAPSGFSLFAWSLLAEACHHNEVLKCFRKCCRSFAGHTSVVSAFPSRRLFCGLGCLLAKSSCRLASFEIGRAKDRFEN